MKPQRVQRKRTKGWRMPENTVYVGRGSKWGNPFKIGDVAEGMDLSAGAVSADINGVVGHRMTAQECVAKYAEMLTPYRHHGPNSEMDKLLLSICNMDAIKLELRGKNLACWCSLDQPCHADILLRIANED